MMKVVVLVNGGGCGSDDVDGEEDGDGDDCHDDHNNNCDDNDNGVGAVNDYDNGVGAVNDCFPPLPSPPPVLWPSPKLYLSLPLPSGPSYLPLHL